MSECAAGFAIVVFVAIAIFVMVMIPPLGWTVLGIILALPIVAAIWFIWRRKRGNKSTSLLPTSAQQAGDASDIPNVPDANPPAFTPRHSRLGEEDIVLQPPPPVMMRGINNGGSNMERPVTYPTTPTLPPMNMDGADR